MDELLSESLSNDSCKALCPVSCDHMPAGVVVGSNADFHVRPHSDVVMVGSDIRLGSNPVDISLIPGACRSERRELLRQATGVDWFLTLFNDKLKPRAYR